MVTLVGVMVAASIVAMLDILSVIVSDPLSVSGARDLDTYPRIAVGNLGRNFLQKTAKEGVVVWPVVAWEEGVEQPLHKDMGDRSLPHSHPHAGTTP